MMFDRATTISRLKALRDAPAPTDLSPGAMCYSPADGHIDYHEYICPTCGNRTIYTWKPSEDIRSLGCNVTDVEYLRRFADRLTELPISVDESQFCSHCSPETTEPVAILVVKWPQREPHMVTKFDVDDLDLLHDFMEGANKHEGAMGRETPLKIHLARIQELLDIDLSTEE